jgi:hypothetical protein
MGFEERFRTVNGPARERTDVLTASPARCDYCNP